MVVADEAMIVLDLQNMLKNMGYDVSDPARSASLTRWRWAFRHTHRLSLIDENQIVINDLILAETPASLAPAPLAQANQPAQRDRPIPDPRRLG